MDTPAPEHAFSDLRRGTRVPILEDCIDRVTLAAELRCSERTIARYEQLPDGLPHLSIGGRKLYRISAVKEWIARRERRPNPVRKAG